VAIRCLIRYARRFKPDEMSQFSGEIDTSLQTIFDMLEKTPLDCMFLPIEAISAFSKLNE